MINPVCVIGTVATEPKLLKVGDNDLPLCSFRLASSERRYDRESGQWVDSETHWFSVTSFRGLAQHAHRSFKKGDRVMVSGRLRIRKWEQDERSGTSVEIDADALGHDLRWGVSVFTKLNGAQGAPDSSQRRSDGDPETTPEQRAPSGSEDAWIAPDQADEPFSRVATGP